MNIFREFSPCFLDYIRTKLAPVLGPNIPYCSPRQQPKPKPPSRQKPNKSLNGSKGRSPNARASLTSKYPLTFSSPIKEVSEDHNPEVVTGNLFDISPIKRVGNSGNRGNKYTKTSNRRSAEKNRSYHKLDKSTEKPPAFQLDDANDFPAIGAAPTASAKKKK